MYFQSQEAQINQARNLSLDDIVALQNDLEKSEEEKSYYKHKNELLKIQLAWYETQLYGSKSEKKVVFEPDVFQMPLGINAVADSRPVEAEVKEEGKKREVRNHKKPYKGTPEKSGIRFDASRVEMEDVWIPTEGIDGLGEGEYEEVSTKISHKVTRQTSYKIIRYLQKVVKIKSTGKLSSPLMPDSAFRGCYADADFVVGVCVDKFKYHLPLYRQQQMLEDAGIYIPRSTLSNWVIRAGEMLEPIYKELLESIKESRVISMDEVPIGVGPSKNGGGLKKGYMWPMYGDKDEVGFVYNEGRGSIHIEKMLGMDFESEKVLLNDGYSAYQTYRSKVDKVSQAYCWAHVRRKFVEILRYDKEPCEVVLDLITKLYGVEKEIRELNKDRDKTFKLRTERSKPVVDEIFEYIHKTLAEGAFLPSTPFTQASEYALRLEDGLRLFLSDPEVPIDNNHTERAIRPIVLGRKNWLFCWGEVGAETLAILQSLISSCVMQGINSTQYLKDVLERMTEVKAKDIRTLLPREWKLHYLPKIESN